jgi:hypothetical protein
MGYDGRCIKKHINKEQVVNALNNTATQFTSHPSTGAASGLPVAAVFGFVPGLITGLKKG